MSEQQVTITQDNQASDSCETECSYAELANVQPTEPVPEHQVAGMAELFKALSDPTRLRIILALMNRELCVCDISELVHMQQSAISHQLRYLRDLRIVRRRKEGKMMIYTLDDSHIEGLIRQGLSHMRHG